MEFGLNQILHLHYLPPNAPYHFSPVLKDRAFGDKAVDPKQALQRLLGDYYFDFPRIEHSDDNHITYTLAAHEFHQGKGRGYRTLQEKIVHRTLDGQLDFLAAIPKPPEEDRVPKVDTLYDTSKNRILGWLKTQEELHGALLDIQTTDQFIPHDDPDIVTLQAFKDNFYLFMAEKGFPQQDLQPK